MRCLLYCLITMSLLACNKDDEGFVRPIVYKQVDVFALHKPDVSGIYHLDDFQFWYDPSHSIQIFTNKDKKYKFIILWDDQYGLWKYLIQYVDGQSIFELSSKRFIDISKETIVLHSSIDYGFGNDEDIGEAAVSGTLSTEYN